MPRPTIAELVKVLDFPEYVFDLQGILRDSRADIDMTE